MTDSAVCATTALTTTHDEQLTAGDGRVESSESGPTRHNDQQALSFISATATPTLSADWPLQVGAYTALTVTVALPSTTAATLHSPLTTQTCPLSTSLLHTTALDIVFVSLHLRVPSSSSTRCPHPSSVPAVAARLSPRHIASMSVEVMSVPITTTHQSTLTTDDPQYAEYLRFKQFQSIFSFPSTYPTDSRSTTPSLYAQAAPYHPALSAHQGRHGHTAYPYPSNANPSYQEDDEEFKGFLSKQFPTIANPAPLGLAAFALTTWVLSMYNVGAWVPSEGPNQVVMGIALAYGGIVQLLAGMWEMRIGNTFGALAFSSYGGFWIGTACLFIQSFGFLNYYEGTDALNNALGIYFMAWTLFTFFMCIASHRTSIALFLLFFFLTITFLLLTIAQFLVDANVHQAAGAFGILTACIAWYAAFAGLLDRKQQSLFRLPVGDLRAMFPTAEEREQDRLRQERRQSQSQRLLESRTMADKQV